MIVNRKEVWIKWGIIEAIVLLATVVRPLLRQQFGPARMELDWATEDEVSLGFGSFREF